jgi:hypothetical protein
MRSYLIPRNVKGETRILTFLTVKSFLSTAVGILIGTLIYFIFKLFFLKVTGLILLVICSLIGFAIGAMKIPETNAFPFFKDTGGEAVDDIIFRYIKFKRKKKIYVYGRKD